MKGGDMKPALHLFPRAALGLLIWSLPAVLDLPAKAEALSLKHAIELALIHSPAAAQSGANQRRAFASYKEARDQYIPQMLVAPAWETLGDIPWHWKGRHLLWSTSRHSHPSSTLRYGISSAPHALNTRPLPKTRRTAAIKLFRTLCSLILSS